MKLKKINFTVMYFNFFFWGEVDIEKVLVSSKISFGEKNCKYFIGYLYDGNKVNPLNVMLPKTSAYVRSYDGQIKLMYFLIEDDDLLKNMILFGIQSVLISEKNLIASLSIIKII